jgi:serine/threonine protein kinase/WD40 repeat protein
MSDLRGHPSTVRSRAIYAADDARLAEALEACRADLNAGRQPDRAALARRYPDLADAIAECLDALEFLHGAAHDLSRTDPARPGDVGTHGSISPNQVLGDFRLRREIGRGGMGVVYEAEQISLGRPVALKVLPHSAMFDPRHLQRFHNEARAAACLQHPNIVPVYAVGTDRGVPYYAMQYIRGQSLAEIISALRSEERATPRSAGAKGGGDDAASAATTTGRIAHSVAHSLLESKLAPVEDTEPISVTAAPHSTTRQHVPVSRTPAFFRTAARIGVQAARALDHAHQSGVVHRDVKPANLLVDAARNVWITDFGLAHCQGGAGLTATGDVVGTVRYMSPEQALGRRGYLDHRTDIYSLGVTLYELVTLQAPFPGEDRHAVLCQVVGEEPPPPARRLNPAVPAELETIIVKAIAKNPAERYATAQELADDLERFLDDRPIRARRPGVVARGRKWARRHRSLVVSLAISATLLIVGAVAGLALYAREQSQLAKDRAEVVKAKEDQELLAKQALYTTLLGKATLLRRAREPGYRQRVFDDLRQAAALGVPDPDPAAVRTEVLACLGDPLGLPPLSFPNVPRARRPEMPKPFQRILREQFEGKAPVYAISPDGKLMATFGGTPRTPRLRNPGTLTLWGLDGPIDVGRSILGYVYALAFAPDSKSLIAGCEEGVMQWVVPEVVQGAAPVPGGLITSFRTGTASSIAVHPNGRLLAAAGRQIELWSLSANRLIASFPALTGARVEFSADGAWLLATVGGEARVGWPILSTPEKRVLAGHQRGVPAVSFSPDGRLLASASKDQFLCLWDAATGQLLHRCTGHTAPIEAVAFSPDSRLVATGDIAGVVRLWDATTGRECDHTPSQAAAPGQVWRLQFDRTGEHLVAGGGRGLVAWSVERDRQGVILHPFLETAPRGNPQVYDIALHPDGDIVFLDADGNLQVCTLAKDAEARRLGTTARVEVRGLNFDAAGRRLTFVDRMGNLGMLDWPVARASLSDGPPVFQVALDGSGRWVATASAAHELRIYDASAGREILALPAEGAAVWALAWSPDATRIAVGLSDGSLAIWDLEQIRARLAEFGIIITPMAVA